MDRTLGIKEHAKMKSRKRQTEVLSTIQEMKKHGEKVTFYSVSKKSGASKSYLYNNEIIAAEIRSIRQGSEYTRSSQSEKAIISSLRYEIRKLNQQISMLQNANSDSYKQKYEKVLEENKELKKQLEKAYTVW